jgi:hypothetical protein
MERAAGLVHEGQRRREDTDLDSLRAALRDALGDEFVALVDSHPELIVQQPGHLKALVALEDPVERMRHARAYVGQLEDLSYPSRGDQTYKIRWMLSPAEAYAASNAVRPPPQSPAETDGERARLVGADERASAQLCLRVEGWLTEVERVIRLIDARTLDQLQADDRQVIEDRIDRVRARLLFLVAGRKYPD